MFNVIGPEEIRENTFKIIGKDWMLITACDENGTANTMTASWGGMGILWQKPVATCYIRPQRYTKEFVDSSDYFTLSFFAGEYRTDLTMLGRVSGRDEDKIANSNLTIKEFDGTVGFAEADMVVVCKKLFAQDLKEDSFIDKGLVDANYPEKDFHTMYIGEIVKVYKK